MASRGIGEIVKGVRQDATYHYDTFEDVPDNIQK